MSFLHTHTQSVRLCLCSYSDKLRQRYIQKLGCVGWRQSFKSSIHRYYHQLAVLFCIIFWGGGSTLMDY